jgi:hypothetical protein
MNWGRGFFRLWVLLSTLWVLVAGAIVVSNFQLPSNRLLYSPVMDWFSTDGACFLPKPEEEWACKIIADAFTTGNTIQITLQTGVVMVIPFFMQDGEPPAAIWPRELGTKILPTSDLSKATDKVNERLGSLEVMANDAHSRHVRETYLEAMKYLGYVLVVPLVILVVGLGIQWTLAGFRNGGGTGRRKPTA